ncbi:hypothetical protein HY448_00230 [Candidatus Pacearchaeota archaeon]|nr:hypothetical protein [Candidatus Pacearchaeota archaeon]
MTTEYKSLGNGRLTATQMAWVFSEFQGSGYELEDSQIVVSETGRRIGYVSDESFNLISNDPEISNQIKDFEERVYRPAMRDFRAQRTSRLRKGLPDLMFA